MNKLSISISGHLTSITLESEFMDTLREISIRQNKSIAEIIREIDKSRGEKTNLSSATRIWILKNK